MLAGSVSYLLITHCVSNLELFPTQGTIFYDTGERYIDEDEEKIVLLPQVPWTGIVFTSLPDPPGPADAFRLDGCHTVHPRTRLEGQGCMMDEL